MKESTQAFIDARSRMLHRYGVEAETRIIDIQSITGHAHALVSGKGPPVVMICGIGTPAAMWAPLMAELNGLKLYAVDLPGYGLTDATTEFTQDLRINAVRFLKEVLDGFNLQTASFIGNSLGSLFTSWLSIDHPERVNALVHVGCPAIVLDSSAPLPMRLLSVKPLGHLLTRLHPPSQKQVNQLSKMVNEYPLVPELRDLLVATERLPGFQPIFLSTLNTMLRLRGSRAEMVLSEQQLEQIQQPTMLFWGRDDPFGSPKLGKKMMSLMPNAKLHIVEGGHAPWLNQSKKIAPKAAHFLKKKSNKPS